MFVLLSNNILLFFFFFSLYYTLPILSVTITGRRINKNNRWEKNYASHCYEKELISCS